MMLRAFVYPDNLKFVILAAADMYVNMAVHSTDVTHVNCFISSLLNTTHIMHWYISRSIVMCEIL